VVLFAFGGLAIGDHVPRRRWQRIVISLAGPGAGFVLYGIVRVLEPYVVSEVRQQWVADLFIMLNFMNLFWNLLNLVPIFPLDGGQVSRELFEAASPRNGLRMSLGVSFLVATVLALHCFLYSRQVQLIPFLHFGTPFSAILFAMLAVENFMMLQQESQRRGPWDDDGPPWGRG
jgi:stage IV sporulation protein FB